MTDLVREKCVACRADSLCVTDDEIAMLYPIVLNWSIINENDMRKLQRVFTFRNFVQSMDFTNQVAILSEEEGHHPRLLIEWGRVVVTWWTHKIRDLHRNDFVMAAKTDQLDNANG
jgi:4a-hydroxytetrahydrobiopterin dehydratase